MRQPIEIINDTDEPIIINPGDVVDLSVKRDGMGQTPTHWIKDYEKVKNIRHDSATGLDVDE